MFRLTLTLAVTTLVVTATALLLAARSVNISPERPCMSSMRSGARSPIPPRTRPRSSCSRSPPRGSLVLLRALRATARQARAQRRLARTLAGARVRELPGGAIVIRDDRPSAMCAGLRTPRIYVTTAAFELLTAHELEAVLAHEAHHRHQRDPLRLAVGQVLREALAFLPPVRRLAEHHALLTEIDADAAAVARRQRRRRAAGHGDAAARARRGRRGRHRRRTR